MQMHTQLGRLGLLFLCPSAWLTLLLILCPHYSLLTLPFMPHSSLQPPASISFIFNYSIHSLLLPLLTPPSNCFPLHSLLSSCFPLHSLHLPPGFSASRMPSTPIAKWRSCVASDTRGAAAQLEAFACCCLCSHAARDGSVTGLTTCQAAQKATTTYFW